MVHKIAIVTHVKVVCLCLKSVLGCKVLIDRTHVSFDCCIASYVLQIGQI